MADGRYFPVAGFQVMNVMSILDGMLLLLYTKHKAAPKNHAHLYRPLHTENSLQISFGGAQSNNPHIDMQPLCIPTMQLMIHNLILSLSIRRIDESSNARYLKLLFIFAAGGGVVDLSLFVLKHE